MAKVPLTLAIGEYDHVRDLFDGTVPVAGVDLTVLRLPVEEMFHRFLLQGEFDVSEVSFAIRPAAGISVARVPPLVDLRSQRRRDLPA